MTGFRFPSTALRALALRVPGAMGAGRWLRRLVDADLRAIERSRRRNGDALFQPFPDTFEERYPPLFDALAMRLAAMDAPRILSFGCSSGAEVRALRRRIPHSRITGIDANPRVIAAARKAGRNPLTEYRVGTSPEPGERYDAILAMAVFRHGELEAARPETSTAILPFARFESGVEMLDAVLVRGGWLAIGNSHFRFTDSAIASGYAVDPLRLADTPRAPLYGRDDRHLDTTGDLPVLFRKL